LEQVADECRQTRRGRQRHRDYNTEKLRPRGLSSTPRRWYSVYVSFALDTVLHGAGSHTHSVTSIGDAVQMSKALYFVEVLYPATIIFLRSAAAFSLVRIAISRPTIILIHCITVINVCFNSATIFAIAFSCVPANYYWER